MNEILWHCKVILPFNMFSGEMIIVGQGHKIHHRERERAAYHRNRKISLMNSGQKDQSE